MEKSAMLDAIKKDARALKYASETLKNDKEVVLAAVTHDGSTLQFASDDLKNDKEISVGRLKL